MKGLILYQGKYGATRQYAEWLSEILRLPLRNPDQVTDAQLADAELVLIGTSIYIGKFLIRDWLHRHAAALRTKKLFLFIVNATPPEQTEKREGYLRNNLPEGLRAGCEIHFLPGRILKGATQNPCGPG